MDETKFDQISKGFGTDASRRQMLGGLIGAAAALLSGASVLEAKQNGKGKGRGRGHGHGRGHGNNGHHGKGHGHGTEKIQVCHRDSDEESFHLITVGAPARGAHERHGDVICEPETCFVATGCNTDGTCITEQAPEGTECEVDGEDGTCDTAGACVPGDDEEEDDEDEDDDDDDDGGEDEDDGDDDEGENERGR